mgnify:CR=1 FL=1
MVFFLFFASITLVFYMLFLLFTSSFFLFLGLQVTTEAMGLGGLRANFLSLWRQRKCGRKDCQKHISRPKRIGVCYGAYFSRLYVSSLISANLIGYISLTLLLMLSSKFSYSESPNLIFEYSFRTE